MRYAMPQRPDGDAITTKKCVSNKEMDRRIRALVERQKASVVVTRKEAESGR